VVSLGGTCKQMLRVMRDESIWRPLVKQTFREAALQYMDKNRSVGEFTGGCSFEGFFKMGPRISRAKCWKEVFMTEEYWRDKDIS
jgi:hypothetical protein